jgi:pyridoxine kinase
MHEKIPGIYHGTGDIFGSSLLAGLMNGLSLCDSAQAAVNFTVDSIKMTDPDTEPRYGVRFESALKQFILRFP